MRASSSATSTDDAAGGQRAHDVGRQAAREDHHAVGVARHRDLDGDRELEVGAREAQLVAPELDLHARQHRQGRAPTGRRSAGVPRASTRTSRSHRNFTPGLAFYRRPFAERTKEWW